jgi:CDP-glycerol glycerophosphotransferase (TagB/SpsB family)
MGVLILNSNNDVFTEEKTEIISSENPEYKFKFSIIMAVYNVEDFISEAIESLLSQTIGFLDNVQLILVDDGSPDNSGAICDEYREKYPDNIVVIHKENGGVSSARNVGLSYAEGKYVNCMDPDDKLTPGTLNVVDQFFENHYDQMDIVGIPIKLFGSASGDHYLNDKFALGTRVINLQKEMRFFQLSCSTAFIKNEIAKQIRFNESLTVAEDAAEVIKIIINKPFLGVVRNCAYMYRRHANSALSTGLRKCWYNDYIYSFVLPSMDYARERYGYVPRFVQNAIMSNLQWRLSEKDVPIILTDEEFNEYREGIRRAIAQIDDDIIMSQKHFSSDIKIYLIAEKYGKSSYVTKAPSDLIYGYDSRSDSKLSNSSLILDFLQIGKEKIKISARMTYLNIIDKIEDLFIEFDEKRIYAINSKAEMHASFLGEPVSCDFICDFEIPRDILNSETKIRFVALANGIEVENRNIKSGPFFPIERKYAFAYYFEDGLAFMFAGSRLMIYKAKSKKPYEKRYCRELWKSNKLGERKAVIARKLAGIYKRLHKKPLWIITDRVNKSGDNGEAFFRYLNEINYNKVDFVYAISNSDSLKKLKKCGRAVNYDSLKYKVMHLAADALISAHADLPIYNPFGNYGQPYKDILASKKKIFLQHGIIESDLSSWLNKYNKNLTGFTTTIDKEYESILNGKYHYSSDVVWLTGLARFDRLYHDEKRYITIMPTWRIYLMSHMDKSGVWQERAGFKDSDYFNFYNSLLNDERVISAAKEYGYTLCFMPHPNIITKIDLFDKNDNVKFFTVNDEYKDVFANSDLVLTDYSSCVFDFAYLEKPIIYAQFDKDEFFGGNHVGEKGYFDFERDGFGEVCYDYENTVSLLIDYMKNECQIKSEYKQRIKNFFTYHDKNNCERILKKIEGLYK